MISLDPNSADWMTYIADTLYWAGFLFWIILGIALILIFWYFISFNIKIHIYEVVGKNQTLKFLRTGRGKLNTKKGVSKLRIGGFKSFFEPPQSEYYMLGRKGKLLNMLKDGTDLRPFQMSCNPGHITIQDHDIRFWASQSMGEVISKYSEPSFFQKYGHYMVFFFGLLVLGWMFYIQLKYINNNLTETTSAARSLAEAIKGNLKAP